MSKKKPSKSLYGDHPSPEPELHFDIFAAELCNMAKTAVAENLGSFTIGIFGSWGSGKTTLMRCIEKTFKEDFQEQGTSETRDYKTVWFNPWKYDGKEVVWNALIQTILREIAQDAKSEQIRKAALAIAGKMLNAGTSVAWNTAKNFVKSSTGLDGDKLQQTLKENFGNYDLNNDPYIFINKFEILFKAFVSEYVGDGKLVVFIDDLDRCLPDQALAVLEALKLYFDQANCIFIIGIDNRIIEFAIRQRYKDTPGLTGREYIEKIIQLNFFLPDKDEEGVIDLLQSEMTTPFADDAHMWSMILKATNANVRKAKQFIISFKLLRSLAERIGMQEAEMHFKLARLLLIQLNFPEFFDSIRRDSLLKEGSILREFDDLCRKTSEEIDVILDRNLILKDFWRNPTLRAFMYESSKYAYIESSDELRSLLRLVKFNAGPN